MRPLALADDLPFAPYAVGGGIVATAGIAALDPTTMRPLTEDFAEQADWVLRRLDAVLAAAGTDAAHVLRLECFLADRAWFGAWGQAFADHFSGVVPPPRTTLTAGLPVAGLLIEVQAIAAVPRPHDTTTP